MIYEKNFNDAYFRLLMTLKQAADFIGEDGYRECWGLAFRLPNPYDCRVNNIVRNVNYQYADAFVEYLLSGQNYGEQETAIARMEKIKPGVKRFLDGAGLPENFSAAYPPKIARQMDGVLIQLRRELTGEKGVGGAGRRAVMHILEDADKLILSVEGTSYEYPCALAIQYMIRNGELTCVVNMRSNHVPLVLCYDVYNLTALQSHIAIELGIPAGPYTHVMNSGHLFGRDKDLVDRILQEYLEDK